MTAMLHKQIIKGVSRLLNPSAARERRAQRAEMFRARYKAFLELLESNTEILGLISELETLHAQGGAAGLAQLRQFSTRVIFHMLRMIASFETLSGKPMPVLREKTVGFQEQLLALFERQEIARDPRLVIEFAELHKDLADLVGPKAANLGELRNHVGLATPDGFAVTVSGYQAFVRENALEDVIRLHVSMLQPAYPTTFVEASQGIREAFLESAMPSALGAAMREAFASLAMREGVPVERLQVSVRSSALGEDGDLSHAGQYDTVLGVTSATLLDAWKRVAASLFSPQALSYQLRHGLALEGLAMSAACVRMVNAVASGVMYTRHPWSLGRKAIYLNAVWGLGAFAVEGRVQPDVCILDYETGEVLRQRIGDKEARLECLPDGGLRESATPESLRGTPCLDAAGLRTLWRAARDLEAHFGHPQDVEWAMAEDGAIRFLQSRPLAMGKVREGEAQGLRDESLAVLVEGGDTACPGLAAGPVFRSLSPKDAADIPEGAILVARHSSPGYTVAFSRLRGVIAEHGSVTGHMASVAREHGVPTLVGVPRALELLHQGQEISLDAWSRRVYAGLAPEALLEQESARQESAAVTLESPAGRTLSRMLEAIAPLTLIDPKSPAFKPENCRTLHDMMRLLHEWSYGEMFAISDYATGGASRDGEADESLSLRLDGVTGLDLHIIDLGGGLAENPRRGRGVPVSEVTSRPFQALLRGLVVDPRTQGPRPVHIKGFLSVMGQQMVGQHHLSQDRFGDRSYAIISDKYLNFSSRVGYHYGVLDCYCGRTVNKNYITFSFKGGAADDVRRSRRARGIGLILERLGFTVEVAGDRVAGRFQKYEAAKIEETLEQMGRLLQYTRQVDMLMNSEASVAAMADCFLDGKCYFESA